MTITGRYSTGVNHQAHATPNLQATAIALSVLERSGTAGLQRGGDGIDVYAVWEDVTEYADGEDLREGLYVVVYDPQVSDFDQMSADQVYAETISEVAHGSLWSYKRHNIVRMPDGSLAVQVEVTSGPFISKPAALPV